MGKQFSEKACEEERLYVVIAGKRVPIHINVVDALQKVGYELQNTIIWERRNIVNKVGIFG